MTAVGRGGDRVANGEDTFPKDGLPSRPLTLTREEQVYWTQLMQQIPNDLFRRVDSHQLATLCELLAAKDRVAIAMKRDASDLPTCRMYVNLSQQINRLSAMYGLSPIDRRRMKIATAAEVDDVDNWENDD